MHVRCAFSHAKKQCKNTFNTLTINILYLLAQHLYSYSQTIRLMRKRISTYCIIYLILCLTPLLAQEQLKLSLTETIRRAQAHSPEAEAARHTLRAAYWNYRFYQANYKPSVTLYSSPNLNREINSIPQPDGTQAFKRQNELKTNLTLDIQQNVAFTGGYFFITSATQRIDILESKTSSYNTTPFTIGYKQSLFGYNYLKWDRRIEPVRYREARKAYAETVELVSARAGGLFFSLAAAQTNLDIANSNYATADTLHHYAAGRYNIGTITENEMLQLELNKLTEETNRLNAGMQVDDARQQLLTFLGLPHDCVVTVLPDDSVPAFEVQPDKALELALAHSPDIEQLKRRQLESESSLASAKASSSLKADLYMKFGLSQTADDFRDSYHNLLDQQYVSLSLSFPLLDWGRGKGRVRVAQSNLDLTNTQNEQRMNDFRLNVHNTVKQFNLQSQRVRVATKTDHTAARRFDVARRLYVLGKSTILDLNSAITEKDAARRNYISALSTYWSLYYILRSITQYDFERGMELADVIHFEM